MDPNQMLGAAIPNIREFLLAIAAVGITIDSFVDNKHQFSVIDDEPMFIIKFSIPEFWEHNVLGTDEIINKDDVIHEFKESMNNELTKLWKSSDDEDYSDDFYEECLKSIRYMYRVRKGEIWTIQHRDEAIRKTRAQFALLDKLFPKSENDYEDV